MCEYKNSREKELCFGRVLIDKKLLSISFFALDCILKACFVQLALLCCVFNTALAQSNESHTISGRIVSASGEGISDVNVFASHTNNKYKVISHSLSDLDGSFVLTFAVESDSILINLTGIGITPKSIVFPNRSMNQDIVVEEKAQELPEVVIRADKIYSRGDTINYSVPAFQNKTDISIGQVLGRIPGISVSELGQIFYKGLPIKNFYIEGLDLMKGRYGIATNSIDPNSIASIQLLENHQDVEALKDLLPEERASINLKLKSGVKGVFNLIGTLGVGYDKKALWENELIATSFNRNSQLLATYKGNNSGVDLMQELRSFDGYDLSKTPILTQIEMPGPPNIKKKYHYMNRSHSGTYNNIFRVGQKGELGFNLAYLNNFYNRERHSKVLNQLPDKSVVQLEELFSGESRSNMLYGIATYLLNEKTTYIKEQLRFDYNKEEAKSSIFAGQNIHQQSNNENYRLSNYFHLVKRTTSDKGIDFISKANFEKRPHQLTVRPNLFPNALSGQTILQEVWRNNISLENRLNFLAAIVWGRLQIHPAIYANYNKNSLQTLLETYQNDLTLSEFNGGVDLNFSASIRRFYARLSLSCDYRYFSLDNIREKTEVKHRVILEPTLFLKYDIGGTDELRFNGYWGYSKPAMENLYSESVLTSYRQLTAYDHITLNQSRLESYSLSYDHKNIASMLFLGGDIKWTREYPEVLYGSVFDGILERINSQETDERLDIFSVSLRASQSYYWKRLKLEVLARYSYISNPILRQEEVMRYFGKSLLLDWDISLAPVPWLFVSYDGSYFQSSGKVNNGISMPALHTMKNSLAIDLSLPLDISLGVSFSHFYNSFNTANRNFLLGEVYAKYNYEKWMFTLSLDNLFNQKSYLYGASTALTESRYDYRIRPRSLMVKVRYRII